MAAWPSDVTLKAVIKMRGHEIHPLKTKDTLYEFKSALYTS